MKVIGFQFLSSTGAKKHNTVLVTDSGILISHNGGRTANVAPKNGFYLSQGRVDFTMLNEAKMKDLRGELEKIYKGKVKNGEYDSLNIIQTPIEVTAPSVMTNTSARSLTQEFYEKATTPGILGIMNFMGATLPEDLSAFDNEIAKFGRKLTDANYDPTEDDDEDGDTGETLFTDIEDKVLRPNGTEYRPREINGHTDVALLREFRKKNIYVRLSGPPGGGKTALAEAAFGKDLIQITGHGDMTVANFIGTWIPRRHRAAGESEWEWVDGPLTRAMKQGVPFLVDEITRIPTDTLNVLLPATDDRRVLSLDDRPDLEPVHAKEGFYVIAGYNPDTLGAKPLDEALISRFKVQINVYTDFPTALALGVPSDVVKIAQKMERADKEDRKIGGRGVWVPQMRELLTFKELIDAKVGVDFALSTLVASCPNKIYLPKLVTAIKEVTHKDVTLPELGGLV